MTDRRRGLKGVASAGLAAIICTALASCSAMAPSGGQAAAGNTPDLQVTFAVSDSGPVAGAPFTLAATVRNAGDAAAEATTLRYYRSADATITTADPSVGTAAIARLGASGSAGQSVAVRAPATPGTYYYAACVDAVSHERETTNNCSTSVPVTVRTGVTGSQGDPDLVVLPATVSDSAPAAGATFTLSAAVRNSGGGVADAATLRYYRSADATITTADTELGTEAITGLAGAGSASKSVDLTAPSTPGTYFYGACVNAVAGESDMTNNCSPSVQVTVPEPQRPELRVTSASVNDNGPVIRAPLTLSATSRNAGGGASEATALRYYR
ncbi:MAG: hypothetical protein OXC31_04540 [Spirochaetaceae bacterium]|nr:hypothetical protein [Spirochaetaceae bacterium]